MTDEMVGVGEAANRCRVPPQVITNLFYRGFLDGPRCPIVGGRRLIPAGYVAEIARVVAARARRTRSGKGGYGL